MRLRRLPIWAYLVTGILLASAGGFAIWQLNHDRSDSDSSDSLDTAASLIDQSTLASLATTDTPIDRTHLADDLAPPTNKWFSGFALQAEPKPGYNYPNSFLPQASGFEFSLPRVEATADIITGPHAPDVSVSIEGAVSYKITDYDELTVELTYYNESSEPILTTRIASGLPYIYLTANRDSNLRFTGQVKPEDSWTSIRSNDAHYGVNTEASGNSIQLDAGNSASFFSAPNENSLDTVAEYADAVVESGNVSYTRRGDDFRTTLSYETVDDLPTLIARLPHQQDGLGSTVTYRSILGDLLTEVGQTITFETPALNVTDQLDLSDISETERDRLVDQLHRDIDDFEPKSDTYFGGKQLYRMAQLLLIADQLEVDDLANSAKDKLKQELESWLLLGDTGPKSFLYDPSMHGIVGNEASFGSDKEFNDHHFHYGYFIYAAAVLAQHDSQFLDGYQASIDLLVADIANYKTDEELPLRRSFDPYAGHSWASGTVPFTDGNNQESTSEAINAWVGVSLWAKQTNNRALQLEADWMLSQEYLTAKHYWMLTEGSLPEYLSDYDQPFASIVWGAKREYSTFFSDEPNAKLAIQLLPLSPTIQRIDDALPAAIFENTSVKQTYGDYILMARPDVNLEDAIALPDSSIDDGNSRTYLYAYILAN